MQSEKRRNSRSFGELFSSWRRGARLMKVRPGVISWKGRLDVLRCRASNDSVWAWVCRDVFSDTVTANETQ